MDIIYAEERTENVIRGDDQYASQVHATNHPVFPHPEEAGLGRRWRWDWQGIRTLMGRGVIILYLWV